MQGNVWSQTYKYIANLSVQISLFWLVSFVSGQRHGQSSRSTGCIRMEHDGSCFAQGNSDWQFRSQAPRNSFATPPRTTQMECIASSKSRMREFFPFLSLRFAYVIPIWKPDFGPLITEFLRCSCDLKAVYSRRCLRHHFGFSGGQSGG